MRSRCCWVCCGESKELCEIFIPKGEWGHYSLPGQAWWYENIAVVCFAMSCLFTRKDLVKISILIEQAIIR